MKERHDDEFRILRRSDQVFVRLSTGDEKAVKIMWARPVSGRGREVSLVGRDKRQVRMLRSLDVLDPESRRIAEEELENRYLVPKIRRVRRVRINFGNRYWDVETDRGPRRFLMKDPYKNVVWLGPDRLIIKDSVGNRYEIEALSALDRASRARVAVVI